ncbi:MAG: fasciclin domain-containing protein [Bacteroidota bacterium]
MKHFFKTSLILLSTVFLLWSCSDDDDNNGGEEDDSTIVDLAVATSDLSSLVAALNQADAGLVETLSGPGPFTVFAPTNAAFDALLASLDDFSSLDDFDTTEERALLASILTYHVVATEEFSGDLSDGQTLATVNGASLTVSLDGGVFIQDATATDAEVTTADIDASNGVIHIIDKVLLPQDVVEAINANDVPSIVEIATGNADFSSLVAALTAADLVDTLSGDGPFTVFAPTNDAFDAFLDANNFATLGDVPVDLLTDVLLNHVVAGTNLSTDLSTGYISSSSTAGAEGRNLSLFIDTTSGVSINGVADVTTPDVAASNGVVHIIDAVIGLPTIVDHAVANDALSSLVSALTADGNTTFTDLLSDTMTDFTVFAPVNDAFMAFTNPNDNDINNVLSYHVISGDAAFSDELMNMYVGTEATNGDGDTLSQYINTDDGVTINGSSDVAIADVVAVNGVVHAVDEVIDLPTVVTFAVADPTFGPLVTALTSATPNTDFATVLSGDGPFTVFAPTDAAFQALLDSNMDWNEVGDIEEGLLTSVLNHHVVSGNIRSGDLNNPGDTTAPTLEGDNITITLPGTGDNIADVTDGGGNDDIGIIVVDVQANNGVIHVLNKVMIPDTSN